MIRLISNLFKRKEKPLRFLGRTGIAYNDGKQEYHIESENLLSKDADIDIAIYYKGIRLMNDERILSDSDKKRIALVVKELMEQKGGKIGIFPI